MKKAPRDIIILHMCNINDDGSWDTERGRQNFFVILDHFLHFCPPNNPKNKISEKMKNPGDTIFYTSVP